MNRLKRALRGMDQHDFFTGVFWGGASIIFGAFLWINPLFFVGMAAPVAIGLIYAAIKGARRGE